jgi:hypothetical protein
MSNYSKAVFTATVFISLFSWACVTKMSGLTDTIERFNRTLKWGGYPASAPMIDSESRDSLLEQKVKEMQGKNIVEYTVGDLSIDKTSETATALVQYSYINQRYQSVHNLTELQIWKYKNKNWFLSKIISPSSPPTEDTAK